MMRHIALLVSLAVFLAGCGQPETGVTSPSQDSPATWIATVTGSEIFIVYVLSVQQGRVLSADVVLADPEALEEFNESDGRKVLPPGLAGRMPVEGLQQSGLTVLGKFQWPPGENKKITFTITLSRELQGSGPVPASVNLDQDQEVHNLVFKRHAGLKIGHKANYENVPGPVAKAKAPPEEPEEMPPGPVVKIDSPLLVAARGGNKAAVASLIAQGAEVNARDDKLGMTPLHGAAFRGHKEIVELLIAHGAAVDAGDKGGRRPLHWAAQSGHRDMVELLIAKGANVNARDKNGHTPVVLASTPEIAKLLLDKGANVKDENGCMSLIYTAGHGWPEVVELLLAKGAKANAKTDTDCTPLHAAHTKEIAGILLAHGADVNAKNVVGNTPLHGSAGSWLLLKGSEGLLFHEAEVKFREVAETLLAHGADVNAKNDAGLTPLHYAAGHGRLEVVEALLAHGAAVNAKDDKGLTPLRYVLLTLQDLRPRPGTDNRNIELAEYYNRNIKLAEHYEAMAKLLRQHGAKE